MNRLERIVTYGLVKKIDGRYFLCDLKSKHGFNENFPVHSGAFQITPLINDCIAFMTWETGDEPGRIQIHQSACVIPRDRYEELEGMDFISSSLSLSGKEFFARSLVTP